MPKDLKRNQHNPLFGVGLHVQILGGELKGLKLQIPNDKNVRPTAALLKRRFFDKFQRFEGIRFVDVCAGAGSIGIEAYSRGAQSVGLVENGRKTIDLLKANCKLAESRSTEKLGVLSILANDALKWAKQADLNAIDQLYFDPPYENLKLYQGLIEILKERSFQGELWVEGDSKLLAESDWEEWGVSQGKVLSHGQHFIAEILLL